VSQLGSKENCVRAEREGAGRGKYGGHVEDRIGMTTIVWTPVSGGGERTVKIFEESSSKIHEVENTLRGGRNRSS